MASYVPDLASASRLLNFSLAHLKDEPAFRVAMKAVCAIEDGPAKLVTPVLDGPTPNLALATKLFRRMGQYRCLPFVSKMICHPAPWVRLAAVEVVGSLGSSAHLALMEGATRDPDYEVRARATKAAKALRVIDDITTHTVEPALDADEELVAKLILDLPHAEGDLDSLLNMLGKSLSPAVADLAARRIAALGPKGLDRIFARAIDEPEASESILCHLASRREPRLLAYLRERINANRHLTRGELMALSIAGDDAFAVQIVALLSRDSTFGYWPEGWAVIETLGSVAAKPLAAAYADPQNVNIRSDAGPLLAKLLGKEALSLLLDAVDDPLQRVRTSAEQGLVALGSVGAFGAVERLGQTGKLARPHLVHVLGKVGDQGTLSCLLALAGGPDVGERRLAIEALGKFQGLESEEIVRAALSSGDRRDKVAALTAAGEWTGDWVIEALATAVFDQDARVRGAAGRGLARIGSYGRAGELDVVRILRARLGNDRSLSDAPHELRAAVHAIVTRPRLEEPRDPKQDSASKLLADLRAKDWSNVVTMRSDISASRVEGESQLQTVIPTPLSDNVSLTITAPGRVEAGATFLLKVWVHPPHALDSVIKRAAQESPAGDGHIASRGPIPLQMGDALGVEISIPDFEFRDADVVFWLRETGSTNFAIAVPRATPDGPHAGMAQFSVRDIPVARLHFIIDVGHARPSIEEHTVREERFLSAFASYASEDRDDVLGRIQGMQKVLPDLDIFVDVAALRSGDNWRERLEREIQARDVLYLFWSRRARASKWVDLEWRIALGHNGLERISPIPLESPDLAPPPSELADLHFNDWMLVYLRPRIPSPAS